MTARLDSRVINAKAVLGNLVRRGLSENLTEAAFAEITESLERQLTVLSQDASLAGGPSGRALTAIQELRRHARFGEVRQSNFLELANRCREALVDLECADDNYGLVDDPIELTNGHGQPVTTLRRRWSPRVIDGGLAAATSPKGY